MRPQPSLRSLAGPLLHAIWRTSAIVRNQHMCQSSRFPHFLDRKLTHSTRRTPEPLPPKRQIAPQPKHTTPHLRFTHLRRRVQPSKGGSARTNQLCIPHQQEYCASLKAQQARAPHPLPYATIPHRGRPTTQQLHLPSSCRITMRRCAAERPAERHACTGSLVVRCPHAPPSFQSVVRSMPCCTMPMVVAPSAISGFNPRFVVLPHRRSRR